VTRCCPVCHAEYCPLALPGCRILNEALLALEANSDALRAKAQAYEAPRHLLSWRSRLGRR